MSDWTAPRLAQCLTKGPAPGTRTAPSADGKPRGDHDLNPDFYRPGERLRAAAVLVPLVARPDGPRVLLTKRTDHLQAHAGQISFPGGRIDPEDRDAEAAALREAEEEVGLTPQAVTLLGRLDTYLTRTGFEVTPVVGWIDTVPPLVADPFEVAEIFEVPLAFFLQPENRRLMSRSFEGKERHFYAFPFGDYFIWGATAGMLNNLVERLRAEEEP